MPHRKWLYNMDNLNSGMSMSRDFSGYLDNIIPDSDVSQQFENPLSFPGVAKAEAVIVPQSTACQRHTFQPLSPPAQTPVSPRKTTHTSTTHSHPPRTLPPSPSSKSKRASAPSQRVPPTNASRTSAAQTPCQAFWSVPEIEECGEVPCLVKPEDQSPQSRRGSTALQPSHSPPPLKKMRRTSNSRSSSTRSNRSISDNEKHPVTRNSNTPPIDTHSSPTTPKMQTHAPTPKQAHSLVEKRYRENLNAKIAELHTVLASAPDGSSAPEQTRKSEVLQTAIDYVNQSQLEMRHMTNDINRLNERVRGFERAGRCEDCGLLKGFDGLRVLPGSGREYGIAAPSAG